MRFVLFSDIHSNWEALQTAIDHAKTQKVDKWIVLGDTVGYGANPNECFEWALQSADIYITGNHEQAVIEPQVREWFSDSAREAIIWTAKVMDPGLKGRIRELNYLKFEHEMTFTHGSPDAPEEFHYLMDFKDAAASFKAMQNRICFVGHTHVPCCLCEKERSARYLAPGLIELEKNGRYILNPGSVGQPRDRDSRLAYGIFDDQQQTFEIFRLEYDKHKAAEKIRKARLPRYLADRLL